MLRRPLRRRAGFSLVEVLVALFIVAAGLIALLSLFPLGAVQMGRALRDDRSQQTALLADARVRHDLRQSVFETPPINRTVNDYRPVNLSLTAFGTQPPVVGAVPSYPVLVDPIGVRSFSPPRQDWVGGITNFIHRVSPQTRLNAAVTPWSLPQAMQYATMLDDMEFAPDGTPANRDGFALTDPLAATSPQLFRQGYYTWAALLQRPDNTIPDRVDMKVLVFDRRPPGVDNIDAELSFPIANLSVDQSVIQLPAAIDTIPLRAGGWILDGTVIPPSGSFTAPAAGTGIRNAHFYRVNAVTEGPGNTTLVELETSIARPTGNPTTTSYNAQLYIFANLIDVYDRPVIAPNGYQKQTP